MSFKLDIRVPVLLGTPDQAAPTDAVLIEGEHFQPDYGHAPSHSPGCACCAPRNQAGQALAALLQGRARGTVPFFKKVIAVTHTEAGRKAVEIALHGDPIASACFKKAVLF